MSGRPRKAEDTKAQSFALTDEELERNIDELRIRAYDDYFQLVGEMYFGDQGFEELIQSAKNEQDDKLMGPVGGILTSAYRENEVLDSWTPYDIALFIGAITRYGRDWQDLRTALPHKSHQELTDFYYGVFKGLRIYPAWKKTRKLKGLEYSPFCVNLFGDRPAYDLSPH